MKLCVNYTRPAPQNNEKEVYGLDVAVGNLLSAYCRYTTAEQLIVRPSDSASFEHFQQLAQQAGRDPAKDCIGLDPRVPHLNLEPIDCQFRPDPLTSHMIWQRTQLQGNGYATCGLVHTMSGERIADAVGQLLLAPSTGADALICPSRAIRDTVQQLWEIQADYYAHRFGNRLTCPVETPVIPLGIHTDKFIELTAQEKRAEQRVALGATDDEVVILFMGRLSFATKAHPLPLFQAAAQAASHSSKKIRLVMYGYFKPQDMESHFRALAVDCQNAVRIDFITNSDPSFPHGLWAAADIFVSLSDNIQESFGLTPIEAMACGLPCVVTDWDGYRDTVRHGQDGFLIPTQMPSASAGHAVAQAYFNQNNYGVSLMGAAQSTAVDIDRCAAAFALLANDDELRKKMGVSARQRAQTVFDWRHIIPAYEDIWRQLTERRTLELSRPLLPDNWQAVHPSYPNPYVMFGSFPTEILDPQHLVQIICDEAEAEKIMAHEMNYFLPDLLQPKESMRLLIDSIRRANVVRLADILAAYPAALHDVIYRCIGWMAKHGVARCWKP